MLDSCTLKVVYDVFLTYEQAHGLPGRQSGENIDILRRRNLVSVIMGQLRERIGKARP